MSANIYDSTAKRLIPFAGNGNILSELSDLEDVDFSSLVDGQVLTYDAASETWTNVDGAAIIESLGDIADVDFDNLVDGQAILWDATNRKWVNVSLGLEDKVDKIPGKGLSTNDYTDADKAIVDSVTTIDFAYDAANEKVIIAKT